MAVWRTFYSSFLDIWSFRSAAGSRLDRERDINQFADALRAAMLLSLACCAILQVGGRVLGGSAVVGRAWAVQGVGQRGVRHCLCRAQRVNTPCAALCTCVLLMF
jgi:hypothetical protein